MGMTDCRTAIASLESFLASPAKPQAELAAALAHLRECPACRARVGRLAGLLEVETLDEDELTCEECEERLPGFLTAESLGRAGDPDWSDVRRHLDTCSHCSAEFAALAEMAAWSFAESGAEPPRTPDPDLSFLRGEQAPAAGQPAASPSPEAVAAAAGQEESSRRPEPALWEQAAQSLYRLASMIPVLIDRTAAAFGALAAPLTVQLAPVPVFRGRGSGDAAEEMHVFRELLELPHRQANVMLKLSLGAVFEGRETLALAVNTIEPPEPIAQARVILRDADEALLEGASTGEDGVVLFRDLDVGAYSIRVEHAGQAWEMRLSLAPYSAPGGESR